MLQFGRFKALFTNQHGGDLRFLFIKEFFEALCFFITAGIKNSKN